MKIKNKTKRTLSSMAILTATIAAIILFNLIVGVAADKIQLRWDLTENKLYALTDETKAVLETLTEEVTLYYFASPGQEEAQFVRVLDMYRSASDKLKIVQIDPNKNPIDARRFTEKGIDVQQNTIVAERDTRSKGISPREMYESYTTQSGQTLQNAYFTMEGAVTRAIAFVAASETKKVYFTTGHNEADYSAVAGLLLDENMEAYAVNLKTQDIPSDVDAIYILSPATDFTEDEILRLDAFLSTGKGAHFTFDANNAALPRLEKYLEEFWGARMYHDVVLEADSSRLINYPYIFIPELYSHTVTGGIMEGNRGMIFMYARSMEIIEKEEVSSSVLAATTDAGFSRHGSDPNVKENIREGALPVAAAMERVSMDGEKRGRIVVSGSNHIYESSLLEEGSVANRSFFYGMTNYIGYNENSLLSVSPKSLIMHFMAMSDSVTTLCIIVVCILPPLIFFVAGFIKWRRRRHL